MHRLISRALAFFRKRSNSEVDRRSHEKLLEGDTKLKTIQGIVTRFCRDHGWINESIYFSIGVVTGNMPLKVGQKVTAVVEEDKTSHGLRAIKVDAFCDHYSDDEPLDSHTGVSLGCITSPTGGADYINHIAYFSLDVLCKDYEPYQGDRVEIEFCIQPDTKTKKALSVKPLRHKHVYEVCITSVHGRQGVVDNSIFFTLDSLKLPAGYVPQPSDIVNVVIVESAQSCYMWRAVSMSPVHML